MSTDATTRAKGWQEQVRQVANAVLYEGYVLYPYRASAAKNQFRWQFGVLAPRPYSEAEGTDPWAMQTHCLLHAPPRAQLSVLVRFLHPQRRTVERVSPTDPERYEPVASLSVGDRQFSTWEEAVEEELEIGPLPADRAEHLQRIALAADEQIEPLVDEGRVVGRLVRTRAPVEGQVSIRSLPTEGSFGITKLEIRIENTTDWRGAGEPRDVATRRALVAAHVICHVQQGKFLSLMDPPGYAQEASKSCVNIGCYPVLAGDPDLEQVLLSSPIILYDYPEIAPESQGDMFDATEIDEILSLRILTLTDEEKREARGTDPRAAAIIDQCDEMTPEAFDLLHGAVRSISTPEFSPEVEDPQPWWDPEMDASVDPGTDTVQIGEFEVGRGARVRLRPNRRADAQDLFLDGASATVAAVLHDVDDEVHLAVTLDDDPASDFHEWYGRYRYFYPDEIEVIEVAS
jgi:hypothetical protein